MTPVERRLDVRLNNPEISDEELAFIEQALIAAGAEYVDEDFAMLRRWELSLTVTDEGGRYRLRFYPETGRVNAEWELYLDKATGEVEEGMSATFEE